MSTDTGLLQKAISQVDRERSYLRSEQCAFDSFREIVRLAKPDSMDDSYPSETTADILDAYREEVMAIIDYESVYGETLIESLEAEFSPTLADVLYSKKPLTQRRKRDLLVAISDTIKNRERFLGQLAEERDALEEYADELGIVEAAIEKSPECSPQNQPLEQLLVVWNVYDTLEARCERLLERRQQQLRKVEKSSPFTDERHARNEYLYAELETGYPVLSAIADVLERIETNRLDNKL